MYERAWRMAPDNFTPPTRTPWGGRVILEQLKADLELAPAKARYEVVGESWEISVEPSFPSRVVDLPGEPLLADLVARAPEAALGPDAARAYGGCPLLVKLLDAALPLSVQVHPHDGHPGLRSDESGKPESWIVIGAQKGAGLYLGFRDGVERDQVADALARETDLEGLLNFVPVRPGDCFELAPGTVHAIGAGVTLVEPQAVLPGKRGVTYRFWDWNRRYDAAGRPDPTGQPRPLHREASLGATDFEAPRGEALVASLRRAPTPVAGRGEAWHERLIDSRDFRVDWLRGSGVLEVEVDRLLGGVVVEGRSSCEVAGRSWVFRTGESFVLPMAARRATLALDGALIVLSAPGR